MNRIAKAFENGKALIAFLTAGDPSPAKTVEFVLAMAKAGADLIEIGVPFSDPTAEGPVIQAANLRALANGMTVEKVFAIVEAVRRESDVPLVLLSYINPVFRMGYETFFAKCAAVGVDGVILPELPLEEKAPVAKAASASGVSLISMVAPNSAERAEKIAKEAEGFVYVVSSMGVTGVRSELDLRTAETLQAVRKAASVPAAVGFGIGTAAQAAAMGALADGVIVGSAVVSIIANEKDAASPALAAFVAEMKASLANFS